MRSNKTKAVEKIIGVLIKNAFLTVTKSPFFDGPHGSSYHSSLFNSSADTAVFLA